jgi:hypothetical protein
MNKYDTAVEWYRQWKTKGLGKKPVPVELCLPQILHGLPWEQTRASALKNPLCYEMAAYGGKVVGMWSWEYVKYYIHASIRHGTVHRGNVTFTGTTILLRNANRRQIHRTSSFDVWRFQNITSSQFQFFWKHWRDMPQLYYTSSHWHFTHCFACKLHGRNADCSTLPTWPYPSSSASAGITTNYHLLLLN